MSKSHPGLPIPDDWNGTEWCRFAICWPDSLQWRAILAGFITTPMLGRTWDSATGTITDVQQIGRDIFESNLDWRYSIVSTCAESSQDFIDAIRYLGDSLRVQNCCNSVGSPGGPGTGGTGSTIATPVPAVVQNEPPDGFDTWADYRTYQCEVATWLLGTIEADLTTMTTVQLAGATAIGLLPVLGALLLDPIPGDELFAIAGLLAGIAYYGSGALDQARDSFITARAAMLCDIIQALDPETARTGALDTFGGQLDSDTADPLLRAYGKMLLGHLLTIDGLNKVYQKDTTRTYPSASCPDCGVCTDLYTTWFIDSVEGPSGQHWAAVSPELIGMNEGDCLFVVSSFTLGASYDPSPYDNGQYTDENDVTTGLWSGGATPTMAAIENTCLKFIQFRSDVAWQLTITLEACP